VGTQAGGVALVRLLYVEEADEKEKYQLIVEHDLVNSGYMDPLLGISVSRNLNAVHDISLDVYRIYMLFYDTTIACYEIRRQADANVISVEKLVL
jgi:hypothetical protein